MDRMVSPRVPFLANSLPFSTGMRHVSMKRISPTSPFLPLEPTSRLSFTTAEHNALWVGIAHPPNGVSFLLLGGASGSELLRTPYMRTSQNSSSGHLGGV